MGGEWLGALSEEEELRRRPEVRIINKYAVVFAYICIGLKGQSALVLLWATVVLLGGFVSDLRSIDFHYLTIIAFVQAAGLFDAMGEDRFLFFGVWFHSLLRNIVSWGDKHHDERTQLPIRQWLKRQIHILKLKIIDITLIVIFSPAMYFGVGGPIICSGLSGLRLAKQDYGIADGDASKANLKPALNLFYGVSFAQGAIFLLCTMGGVIAERWLNDILSQRHGFSLNVLLGYSRKTMHMGLNDPASIRSWNLITYGADLLDSQCSNDYAAGVRILTMLIDRDIPLQIRRLLIRSPKQRIQKLIGTLAWISPAEQETRWLAATIVEHLAADLNLAHFPGALECVSSLFDATHLPFEAGQGTKDLVLPGLRILHNLAHDGHNCTMIYSTKGLLSKIVAPLSSNEFVEDIKSSVAWTKVVDVSLKVVTRLMGSPGSTGQEMRSLIANASHVVRNLEAVLDIDMKSNSSIIWLLTGALDALTRLVLHHPESASAGKLIERALHIFLSTDWLEDYLKHEKNVMKKAKKTVSQLKEYAGFVLEMLSNHPEAIKSFTVCDDDIHRLTELLDCNIKTTECKISATETVEIDISIGSRISSAVILKHLSNYVKLPTLRKALRQLLPVQQDEASTLKCHIKDRMMHAALLSLVVTICANTSINLAGILLSQTPSDTLEDFVVRLKKMVEENMYATPTCLAIQKLTCQMVTEFMKHDRNIQVIDKHNIVGTLLKASKTMAELESSMLFAAVIRDRYGVPLKPLSSVLSKNTEDLLTQRKQALGIYTVPASVPIPLP
ncbi:unnamed protein product [Triticum aestivum]|uniref:Uncharacterized protein n=5 Tax=Triticinae TaxID=1648030 RepID=A0A9R1JJB0_WHEAT|nr:uncharacterized protein LOC123055180 [Triticum aestivum]KAF7019556.1 hypothetical protein CFC21_032717 [Triticum aestivum]SPT20849.1 unnamed protein product [Triticum aestivum]